MGVDRVCLLLRKGRTTVWLPGSVSAVRGGHRVVRPSHLSLQRGILYGRIKLAWVARAICVSAPDPHLLHTGLPRRLIPGSGVM